jgi:hypothetical protein
MNKRLNNVNDYHKALWDWEDIKELMVQTEGDFLKFYGPTKTKRAGTRARKRIIKMIDMLYEVRKKLLKQRQDYDSEY